MDFIHGNETAPHLMILNTVSPENNASASYFTDMEGPQRSPDVTQNDGHDSIENSTDHPLFGLEDHEADPATDDAPFNDTQSLDGDNGFQVATIPEWMCEDSYQEYVWASPVEGEIADWAANLPPGSPQSNCTDSSYEWSPAESVQGDYVAPGDYSYDADDDNSYSSIDISRSSPPGIHSDGPPFPPRFIDSDEALNPVHTNATAAQPIGGDPLTYWHLALHDPPAAQRVLQDILAVIDDEVSYTDSTRSPSPVWRSFPDLQETFDLNHRSDPPSRSPTPESGIDAAEIIEQYENYMEGAKEKLGLHFDYSLAYSPKKPVRVFFPPPGPREAGRSETTSGSSSPINNSGVLLEEKVTPDVQSVEEQDAERMAEPFFPSRNDDHGLEEEVTPTSQIVKEENIERTNVPRSPLLHNKSMLEEVVHNPQEVAGDISVRSSPLSTDRVLLEYEVTPAQQSVKEGIAARLTARALKGRNERPLIFYNSDATDFPYPPPRAEDFLAPDLGREPFVDDPLNLFRVPDNHDQFLAGLAAKAQAGVPLRRDTKVDFVPMSTPAEPFVPKPAPEYPNHIPFAPEMVYVRPGMQALAPRTGGYREWVRPTSTRTSASALTRGEQELGGEEETSPEQG